MNNFTYGIEPGEYDKACVKQSELTFWKAINIVCPGKSTQAKRDKCVAEKTEQYNHRQEFLCKYKGPTIVTDDAD